MNEPSRSPLIEARGLIRLYPEGGKSRAVLKDVDLDVQEGRFAAVMGQSGSGKSTLLHILSGLEPPTSGTVRLAGQELGSMDEHARTLLRRVQVGFVFQFFNLVPNLSVAENVALPLRLTGVKRPRKDPRFLELVTLLGLADKLGKRPHELSGGEMQRTSIARALVHQPRIVFADEPTGNLSSRAGAEVMQFLRRSVDELGQTVLLVTHNPRDAQLADEIHFIQDGRIQTQSSLSGKDIHEDRILACMAELGI
jgi:putative ABC transport system ATP-binding protein